MLSTNSLWSFVKISFSCWLVGWINVDLAIFQPYLDLEAGNNQSLKIQVARPGIEPRSSCSASQKLNHLATAAPKIRSEDSKRKVENLGQARYLFFPIGPKTINLETEAGHFIQVSLRQIPFSGCKGEIDNVSANHSSGRSPLTCARSENRKHGRVYLISSCQVSYNYILRLQMNISQSIRGQGGYSSILIFPKNTYLEDVVDFLRSAKLSQNFVQQIMRS